MSCLNTIGTPAAGPEARHDLNAAMTECAAAVASARSLGLAHYISFALTQNGRTAALTGDLPHAEAALAEAIDTAERAGVGWFAAIARVGLADVRQAQDDSSEPRRCCARWLSGAWARDRAGRVTFFGVWAASPSRWRPRA
jgi:hypothetical protein